jgi:hypothetical protein
LKVVGEGLLVPEFLPGLSHNEQVALWSDYSTKVHDDIRASNEALLRETFPHRASSGHPDPTPHTPSDDASGQITSADLPTVTSRSSAPAPEVAGVTLAKPSNEELRKARRRGGFSRTFRRK